MPAFSAPKLTLEELERRIAPTVIAIASVDSARHPGEGSSHESAVSADGRYVAFASDAPNLVPGDTNGMTDIFVHDMVTGTTTRVSVDSAGTEADSDAWSAAISADGRYVAFASDATNLVLDDTNSSDDIFVHDMVTGTTTRVSVDSAGNEADWYSFTPAISADGRYVAFQSGADNLVASDTNGSSDIFLHDTVTGTTTRVSVDSLGNEAYYDSYSPAISADGRYVAFHSYADNLIPNEDVNGNGLLDAGEDVNGNGILDGDTNWSSDIFLHDMLTGTTTRVSVDSLGNEGDNHSYSSAISADGRYVAFTSDAANLVLGDTNGAWDVFVHDVLTGATTRVSVDSYGYQADSYEPGFASISADGRYVAFSYNSENLVPNDTNGSSDIFVHDMLTGVTGRVSVGVDGREADGSSYEPVISADGRYVAFSSDASNLVPPGFSGWAQVFVTEVVLGGPPTPAVIALVSVDSDGHPGEDSSYVPAVSADGRYVAFCSDAPNLIPNEDVNGNGLLDAGEDVNGNGILDGDTNGMMDIFVHDMLTGVTGRVSVGVDGREADGSSYEPAISADGRYVAFESWATNLVAGDTNGSYDIFVHDMVTGSTTRVSVDSDGNEADLWSNAPAISADGRYVAFESWATNLVPGDTNGAEDIFVHDMLAGTTTRVSVDSDGNEADLDSYYAAISADGRYVAFACEATNLVPGDTNHATDMFVHDMVTGSTTRVSVDSLGNEADGAAYSPAVSADGRYVAFESWATNLVPGDTNDATDIFLHDMLTGTTTRVSVDSYGYQAYSYEGGASSFAPGISADGRYVAFGSYADNLVAGDTNGETDIFVHDMVTGVTGRVSVGVDGREADGSSDWPAISADGRYVAFSSEASNLAPPGFSGWGQVFVTEVVLGGPPAPAVTAIASVDSDGNPGEDSSYVPAVSADGRYVAFDSYASDLVPGDTNGVKDIFVRDMLTGTTTRVSMDSLGNEADYDSNSPAISADGRYVAFESYADNLVAGDTNQVKDIFVHDMVTGTTTRVSVDSAGNEADVDSYAPTISADGRYVAFESSASNLVAGDTNGVADIFVHDMLTGSTTRVSVDSLGNEADGDSLSSAISADGRYVAFVSWASNLVPVDANFWGDIFVHDMVTGSTTLVSVDSLGNQVDAGSYSPAISADGRYVAFSSYADDLVPGDTNGSSDIFLHDMVTGTTTRVSVDSCGYQADSYEGGVASISADGRYVAFASDASNLIPNEDVNENGLLDAGEDVNGNGILDGDTNGMMDIFVHDMLTGVTGRVSVGVDGREADGSSYEPAISADGRYVAFESDASNLVPPGFLGSGMEQVFVTEVVLGGAPAPAAMALASVDPEGNPGDFDSYVPAVSADGRYVAFASNASNLVPGDTNSSSDIFVHDMVTGSTTRVSVDSLGNEADYDSQFPAISADGRYVAFESYADNLVPGDTNGWGDIFVHDMVTGTTTRVSVDSLGNEADDASYSAAISADGRYVAFESSASNLVAGDTNQVKDIFVHDMVTGTTTRVSVDSLGNEAADDSLSSAISADGRYVAFVSWASNLVPVDTNGSSDIFVHDVMTGTTTRVSVDSLGNEADYASYSVAISADGRYVAFSSWASNLVPGDTNDATDVFVHDRLTGTTTRVSVDSYGYQTYGASDVSAPSISADGRYVAFSSDAEYLVPGDFSGSSDIFVHDMVTGVTGRVSVGVDGREADGPSYEPAISADGRYVAFESYASNLVPPGFFGGQQIFVTQLAREIRVTDSVPPGDDLQIVFGDVLNDGPGGVSASEIFTITNDGNYALTISSVTLGDGTHFSVSGLPGVPFTLDPGASHVGTLTFDPSATGPLSDTLIIASDDPDQPTVSFALDGGGVEPNIAVTDSVAPADDLAMDLGNVLNDGAAGVTATGTVTISNTGTADLTVTGVSLVDGVYFAVDSFPTTPFVLTPGSSQDVTVTFDPTVAGALSDSLVIASDDPDQPTVSFALDGTGVEPNIAVTDSVAPADDLAMDLGSVLNDGIAGVTATGTVTISNTGTADLTVTGVSLVDGAYFAVTSFPTTPFVLTPGSSQDVTVTFDPTVAGALSDSLVIASDDPDQPTVSFTLDGGGVEPNIAVTDSVAPADDLAMDLGSVPNDGTAGATATGTVTISNTGTADLTVTGVSLVDGAYFAVTSFPTTPFVLTPGSSQDVTVTFDPTVAGALSDTLVIGSDDPDQPTVPVALAGNGTAVAPDIAVTDSVGPANDLHISFGTVVKGGGGGGPVSETFTITNEAGSVLTVNSVALADGTDFRVSGLLGAPFTVDPGSSWTGTITLDPQTPGALSDTLVIQSDDPDEATVNVALDGTAWIGVGVWRREGVAVTAYDTLAPLDANLGDIRVWVLMRRGELLGVSRVVLGGQQPMDGVGILIQGADYRCRVIDARRGPIGELAFIASDSSLASVDLRGSIRGTDLNGMTLGGVHLAADLDADGELADLTALYVNGQLGAAKLAGSLGGDVLIGGSLGSLQAGGSLSGDMTVGGNAGDLRVAGEFGVPGSRLTVGGSLRSLLVGSRGAAADLVADVAVLGSLGRATIYGNICAPVTVQGGLGTLTARLICDRVSVAGDLGSLTTSSDLQPGSHPVDFHFHNPGAEADGSLTVDGLIRRIRHV